MTVSGLVVEMDSQSYLTMRIISYQFDGEIKIVKAERDGAIVRITIADRLHEASVLYSRAGELTFTVDGTTHTVYIASDGSTRYVAVDGNVFELREAAARRTRGTQHQSGNNLIASMPGQVTKVLVNEGDTVQRGQPLVVLEAMKMEIKIAAPHDGRVAKVLVQQGQRDDRDQSLVEISQSGYDASDGLNSV